MINFITVYIKDVLRLRMTYLGYFLLQHLQQRWNGPNYVYQIVLN